MIRVDGEEQTNTHDRIERCLKKNQEKKKRKNLHEHTLEVQLHIVHQVDRHETKRRRKKKKKHVSFDNSQSTLVKRREK